MQVVVVVVGDTQSDILHPYFQSICFWSNVVFFIWNSSKYLANRQHFWKFWKIPCKKMFIFFWCKSKQEFKKYLSFFFFDIFWYMKCTVTRLLLVVLLAVSPLHSCGCVSVQPRGFFPFFSSVETLTKPNFPLFQINVIEAKKKTDIVMAVSLHRLFTLKAAALPCRLCDIQCVPIRCCRWWRPRRSSSSTATSRCRSWTSIDGSSTRRWRRRNLFLLPCNTDVSAGD